jgi:acetylornithine aminotransferase
LACAAALAVVETIVKEDLCAHAKKMGDYLRQGFNARLAGTLLTDIRGHGLMIGLVLSKDCPNLMADALAQGVLLNVTAGNVVRLLPPLNITQDEADQILDKVSALIKALA